MAQFRTHRDAETFARTYCRNCIHQMDCPIMAEHMAGIDTGEVDDPDSILHKLIVRTPHGNDRCALFVRAKRPVAATV